MNALLSDVDIPPSADTSDNTLEHLRSSLDSITDNMAVIDTNGIIVMVNAAWQQMALTDNPHANRAAHYLDVGSNYFDVASCCDSGDQTGKVARGIRDVLSARIEAFCLSYPCHTSGDQHWFTITVTPVKWEGQRGALLTRTDTTPRHRLHRGYPTAPPGD
ncbi:PAS domain-containing protein [Rhodoferax sp.]|uniref:PAS domain-containing protein n=1 Tax=Rhodoferax sp. TaxID=50421 RepID=UPI00284A8292|nr:PAS domain-containing protein [Rhodoferax sp.]MDR3371590.1 PAS domain-containing protein [Rhodoferax sp.]